MANTIILPFSELQAELNDEAMIDPNAIIEITENGRYNVARYGYADVNVEGGGGETWQTVFEGSVTTEESGGASRGSFQGNISEETIKVTFNGTEYTCNRTGEHPEDMYRYGATYSHDEYNFTDYPFCIEEGMATGTWTLITETAGTYTLKIEEPQSGGSSDFSTANVTIVNGSESAQISIGVGAFAVENQDYTTAIILDSTHGMQPITEDAFPVADSLTTTYVLITNKSMIFWKLNETRNVYAVTGNAEIIGVGTDKQPQFIVKVSGDCTITIS